MANWSVASPFSTHGVGVPLDLVSSKGEGEFDTLGLLPSLPHSLLPLHVRSPLAPTNDVAVPGDVTPKVPPLGRTL